MSFQATQVRPHSRFCALLLFDGKEIRVGDGIDRVVGLLGPNAGTGGETREKGPIGDRITRAYEYSGTRFILVFEPFETKGQPRVAAIYIQ